MNNCLVCSNELTPFQYYLVFENGGLICSECMSATNNRILLSETEIRFLKYLSKNEIQNIKKINTKLLGNADIQLYRKLSEYIKYHTNQELKSEKIFFSSLK